MRKIFRAIKNGFLAVVGEFKRHVREIYRSFHDASLNFLMSGSVAKKLVDLFLALSICIISPLVAVGIASANFIDTSDTLTAALSAAMTLIALEILSFWSMEFIVVLVALQVSRFTSRVVQNYKEISSEQNTTMAYGAA